MKATDFIRTILDVIDQIDASTSQTGVSAQLSVNADTQFKQIFDLLSTKPYSTQPDPAYADVDAVTVDAGGGLNGPKHPSEIRGTTISLYPNSQYGE
jgi:hypothetical protein